MDENIDNPRSQQDRRLQTLVYELDKKVHALELSAAQYQLQIVHMQGEIVGIRSSTASSFQVEAASKLIGEQIAGVKADIEADRKLQSERMLQLGKEVAGMRRVLLWVAATLAAAVISAIQFKLVIIP